MTLHDAFKLLGIKPHADEVRRHRAFKTKLAAAKKSVKEAGTDFELEQAVQHMSAINQAYEVVLLNADSGFLGGLKPEVDKFGQSLMEDTERTQATKRERASQTTAPEQEAMESNYADLDSIDEGSLPEPMIDYVEPIPDIFGEASQVRGEVFADDSNLDHEAEGEAEEVIDDAHDTHNSEAEESAVGEQATAEYYQEDAQVEAADSEFAEELAEEVTDEVCEEQAAYPDEYDDGDAEAPAYEYVPKAASPKSIPMPIPGAVVASTAAERRSSYHAKKKEVNKAAIVVSASCAVLLIIFLILVAGA